MIDYSEIQDKIFEQLTVPYVYYAQESIGQKKILARYVLGIDGETIMIPSAYVFSYDAVVAGLSERQIEYIAKNAPIEYKKELSNSILNEYKMKDVFEIARAMDEDMGEGATQNQRRIKSVYQYITDNWAVFQF